MAGHSKWAQIKRQKGATDAARSKEFAKYSRIITLESKKHAGNVSAPSLATAIARAKAVNMPKDTLERAIAKGISKDVGDLDRFVYEAFGPGGCALIIVALTDNRNRTVQEVKHALTKNGLELGAPGSSTWAFQKQQDGTYLPNEPKVDLSAEDESRLETVLGALDDLDDVEEIFTNANGYEATRDDE